MTFFKISFSLIFLAVFSGILFFQLNKKNKAIIPLIKRTSLESIEIIRLPKNEDEIFSEALVRGQLLVDDRCLKLDVLGSDTIYTLVWSSFYKIEIENQSLVIKHNDKIVGQEGRNVELSGGEAPDISHLKIMSNYSCNQAPYWLIGSEMKLLK